MSLPKKGEPSVSFGGGLSSASFGGGASFGGRRNPLAVPEPDPLADVVYTDNDEQDSKLELEALESAFVGRRKAEDKRYREATDSEYWFAVCFKTRAEKNTFLAKYKLLGIGDKYLDGGQVDAALDG